MKDLLSKAPPPKKVNNKFRILVWSLFDFANTSYSIVVVTFLYAVYFKEVIAGGEQVGDLYWGLGTSISMIITAIISPILGAISDFSTGKKRFLLFFTIICIISTFLLYFTGKGTIFFGLLLFIIANIGFEAGLVFYDSFLPELTTPKNYGRVSGYGFAFGYLGSLATLGLVFPFIQKDMIKETFPVTALFFLVFAVPLFIFLKDTRQKGRKPDSYLKIGFNRVYSTLSHLKNYKNLALFLAAFFFYIEGVNTVIYFSAIFAKSTLQYTDQELIIFFMVVQSTAILGAVFFGIMADSIGQKKTIVLTLFIWIFTVVLAYYTSSQETFLSPLISQLFDLELADVPKKSFFAVGLLAGSVMGATQSTSRSLMSSLTPFEKKTEFFGFYSFFGKSSAVLGPLVFGAVSYMTGSQRIAILTIGLFFLVGLLILGFVKDTKTEVPPDNS